MVWKEPQQENSWSCLSAIRKQNSRQEVGLGYTNSTHLL